MATKTRDKFSTETFEALAEDLKSKRVPLDRITVSDSLQVGLRAIIRDTGNVSYHVQYEVVGKDGSKSRPYLTIGHYPETTVAQARKLAKTVIALAGKGIDVQAGLHEKLIKELIRDGERWKP